MANRDRLTGGELNSALTNELVGVHWVPRPRTQDCVDVLPRQRGRHGDARRVDQGREDPRADREARRRERSAGQLPPGDGS